MVTILSFYAVLTPCYIGAKRCDSEEACLLDIFCFHFRQQIVYFPDAKGHCRGIANHGDSIGVNVPRKLVASPAFKICYAKLYIIRASPLKLEF